MTNKRDNSVSLQVQWGGWCSAIVKEGSPRSADRWQSVIHRRIPGRLRLFGDSRFSAQWRN